MSGYRSSLLRHECDRDGCYQDRMRSWDWMRGCFPRGSMPTDLDGVIEINGHVLFIEQKGPGGFVSGGQARALRRLAQLPDAAVWLIRQTDDPDVFECIYRDGDTPPSGWHRYTVLQMQTWLRTWADAAERSTRLTHEPREVTEPRGRDPPSSHEPSRTRAEQHAADGTAAADRSHAFHLPLSRPRASSTTAEHAPRIAAPAGVISTGPRPDRSPTHEGARPMQEPSEHPRQIPVNLDAIPEEMAELGVELTSEGMRLTRLPSDTDATWTRFVDAMTLWWDGYWDGALAMRRAITSDCDPR